MIVSRDQSQMEGRWFWGGYDEFGIDVTLRRAGNDPAVFGLDRTAVRSGSPALQVGIHGDNLPAGIQAGDIDLGSGVAVKRIVSATPKLITVEIDVAPDAIPGKRDVAVRRAVAPGAFAIYDKIDYLKVAPEAALARLGGTTHPKGYQQFEAIAWNRGPDNKPNTPDDVNLGPVEAQFSVEEFLAVYGDDDKDFVGKLSPTGLFTPATEGPNPKRRFGRNNYGDVWVVATHTPKETPDKPITARAHLVVTIPLYVRWDQPEVAQ
jgi:quinohemoprotein amine dehydrogenase